VTRSLPCRNLGDGLTAALQEPVAQPIGWHIGPFSFCRNGIQQRIRTDTEPGRRVYT
jgi:hypothetical protein